MLAIHNNGVFNCPNLTVANAFAKLSKCQQFTTIFEKCFRILKLQTLLQSYQNVSNSQPYSKYVSNVDSCKRFCKVIKMLAIHNYIFIELSEKIVANAFAKLSKCQQFTTLFINFLLLIQLQTLMQSYQNVSNSQQLLCKISFVYSCKRLCKVIKMLAIHN